jgi:PAS domain S-box-containing protein
MTKTVRAIEHLASVVEQAHDSILEVDFPTDTITSWNRGAENFYGYPKSEALGKSVHSLLHTTFPKPLGHIKAMLAQQGTWEGDLIRARRDHSCVHVHSSWTLFYVRGAPVSWLEIDQDITRRKTTEWNHLKAQNLILKGKKAQLETKNAQIQAQARLLEDLSGRLLKAHDDERQRIAFALHDRAGQNLSGLLLKLGSLQEEVRNFGPRVSIPLAESIELGSQVTHDLRNISYLLHPPLMDELGLLSTVQWYADEFKERSSIDLTLDLPAKLDRLPPDLEIALFRMVEECLSNIDRHSESRTACIHLRRSKSRIVLEIVDEGRGIPAERLTVIGSLGSSGLGLRGVQQRVKAFGGKLEISSNASGTVVRANIPIFAKRVAEHAAAENMN